MNNLVPEKIYTQLNCLLLFKMYVLLQNIIKYVDDKL